METTKKTSRFYLASASARVWSRVLDLLICGAIVVVVNLILLLIINHNLNLEHNWNYLLVCLISVIIFSVYFVICPYFFSGITLGMKILNIKILLIKTNKKFFRYILREVFLTLDVLCIALIIGFYLLFIPKDEISILIREIINGYKVGETYKFDVFVIIISTLLMFYFVSSTAIFINLCYRSQHENWIDSFSGTAIVYTKYKAPKIKGDTPIHDTNPMGVSKNVIEEIKKLK